MNTRGILTLAFGQPKFIAMAKSLARSLALHDPALPRAVVTDSADPELAALFTHCIQHRPAFGPGVRQKMYLDLYSPFDETLFLDCDSLAVRSLDPLWRAFQHLPFGVCGNRALRPGDADEYLDVDFALQHFSLASLPKFNGGVYYFNRSPEATAIFIDARRFLRRAAELRFGNHHPDPRQAPRYGDAPCDEPLYSVAMALHGLSGVDMGAGGMAMPAEATGTLTLDIPSSLCTFVQDGRTLAPDLVHFVGATQTLLYRRECQKLRVFAQGRQTLSGPRELLLQTTAATLWMRRMCSASLWRNAKPAAHPH